MVCAFLLILLNLGSPRIEHRPEEIRVVVNNSYIVCSTESGVVVKGECGMCYSDLSPYPFVIIRIRNGSDVDIGVDLTEYADLIRVIHMSPVDRELPVPLECPPGITPEFSDSVIEAFQTGELTIIEPHGVSSYFIDCTTLDMSDITELQNPSLNLFFGGWIVMTDGVTVEYVRPELGYASRWEFHPIPWSEIQPGSLVAYTSESGTVVEVYADTVEAGGDVVEDWSYPENAAEWKAAIDSGLELDEAAGSGLRASGQFPYDRLETWVRDHFTEAVGEVFVDAVVRNCRGLAEWAYGNGSEPNWRGSDSDNPGLQ